ncbi:MAG: Crp/Fnr family transcriptional regulator [Candidatus Thiodiazotropha lotti]|uniref:Crp/Fnr family transcriptional regulator n=1 Tax=Candidatus Thiodiazotropha lotti TaxID=2792787 RepID=A0A9E4K2Y0_9GAMM|nr:Crp/Fnr family transcriptional regulator [Candidatus Thiodiazotropha lotti]ODC02119.1 cAMP-binding protein [Candidatus Thiodiazotropha endoloripes]MCG7921565.1 Crp/Fnr family transcriptional regulator [Candidatus Thiodiazotropha lotti]MCG7929439.1 Crp/Fnr family transcriptional regulator [Candidatus Thiodiazotropha lotti]MCG7938053.1 Crp/Fnr family transcriptional regulator [Candidatus Thiodiazotropha lotti]
MAETFLELTPSGQELFENGVVRKCFSKPTAVIHKGQVVSGAYLVTQGRLRVFTYTPQGSEATLYFLDPGETCVLALNCLFNDLRYPAWVETDGDTHVDVIPGALYRKLFEAESTVQNLTVKALSSLVFRLMEELEQVHACNLDQRLANFILSNASEEGILRMTQQALGGHLGTTREVIARLMQGFVAEGAVETRRGAVVITDAAKLAQLIEPAKL